MSFHFTTEELEKVDQLRKRMTANVVLTEEQSSEYYLIKWLRARGMDVGKAEEMLRKSLKWREENGVDTILETMELPEDYVKTMPFAYLGTDPKSGCPLFLYLMGRFDMRSHLERVGLDTLLRYNIYVMEYFQKVLLKDCTAKAGRPINQIVELIDLDGYNYRQIANSECRDMMMKMQLMFDLNYPEFLHHVSMINAPRIFSIIYNIAKTFMSKATMEKISIYGTNNWQDDVCKRFPMELIPPHFGGTRPGRDAFCSGDPMWIFGLDKDYFNALDVIKVNPRDKVHLEFDVSEEGSSLVWKFKSEGHDICFGIFHDEVEVLPISRVDSHKEMQTGELPCRRLGKYTVVFDNTYSYTKGKNVHHKIEIVSSFTRVSISQSD